MHNYSMMSKSISMLYPQTLYDFVTAWRYAKRGIWQGSRVSFSMNHSVGQMDHNSTPTDSKRRVSVCLCLSVTLRYCIKTAKPRITQITPHDSPETLVFWRQRSQQNSNWITLYGDEKCKWGGLKLATFEEKRAITRKRYKIDA